MFKVTVKELRDKKPCSMAMSYMESLPESKVLTFPDVIDVMDVASLLWVVDNFCPHEDIISLRDYEKQKQALPTNAEKREFDQEIKDKIIEIYG